MRPRAVYDTNVVVSAALKPASIPASLVALATAKQVRLFYSLSILEEYTEVLKRPKFDLDPAAVDAFLYDLTQAATRVRPTRHITACPDEDDNRFLECADRAKAQYVVTGNKRHFPFAQFESMKIVSPAEFVRILTEEGSQPSL